MDNEQLVMESIVTPELYFLISKFLAAGPLQETAKVLVRELEDKKVLPKRTDWHGVEHEQTFIELEQKYAHIGPSHLLEICCRIGPILDHELAPSVPGILSLLGAGRQSLLRTKDSIYRTRSLLDYCTRIHGVSLPDSSVTKPIHNFQKVITGREYGGPVRRKLLVPTGFYNKTKLLRRTVGHLSSVYCVLFDRTGRYIITGADDLLIKIWSAMDGRLLATLRGASAEITDIAINLDNTMLAAGSLDRILRVWDMQTTSPIAVLTGHTGMITSVNFCPSPRSDLKYLVTTSTDGSIAFWSYSTPRGQKITFAPKPTQYHEKLRPGQAQMMCTTFSPGGMFLAAGSADHHVRVYIMSEDGPKRILESEAYTDAVDSVQWSHRGLRFISGSKDGTAHIWTFESQQWKSVKLCMTERMPSCPEPEEGKKLKVTMVAWDCSDKYVITAANDFTIKIWNSKTAKLHCVLRGHKDELYVLESNPKDEHVLLSAGHDGQVFLWDIEQGISVAHFVNNIDGQGHGGVFDAKWSPDGTMIAATDSHGHILIFGLGFGPDKYKLLPTELFFHTDYRPLLRDAAHHVVDEQTQIMPHLMPPPFLVDADGNPHPANFQRFVPGRENCATDQLIPNLTVGADGVIEDNSNVAQNPVVAVAVGAAPGAAAPAAAAAAGYSHIDRLIAAMWNRQGGGAAAGGNNQGSPNVSQLDRMIEALANRQGQDQAPDSNNRASPAAVASNTGRAAAAATLGNVLGNGPSTSRNGNDPAARRPSDASSIPRQGTTWGRPPAEQQRPPTAAAEEPQQVTPPATSANGASSPQFKYIRRIYVRPMKYAQLQNLKQTVYAAGQFEMQEYKREMRRRPIMINTASALSSQAGGGAARQRNARNGGGSAGGASRTARRRQGGGAGAAQAATPAYRTRAVRDQEEVDAPPAPEEEEDEESSASSGDTSYSNVEANLEDSSDDSDTESSDYSDWVADTPGPNLEPPKRSKRKPLSRRRNFSDDSSDETTEQATTSASAAAGAAAAAAATKSARRNKRVVIPPPMPNGEIPELYRPTEWLSEVIPRKAPYYPQMGDEVVYFRQGHHRYLEAVRTKKVYKLTHSSEPWNFRTLRDHELVRVIGIKYEIRPPRLCCLKLAMIDEEGNMTGTSFKIKYHDMPDVLDFLVLRQTFALAVQRNWAIGDRFRCMIGDGWWMGQIESRHALAAEFPDSFFMCFRVRWDNGEYEYMSPWDMEPIDENRLPDEVGGAVPVLPEEIRATLYQPKSEEWHRGDRDGSCRRIINGLEQVMRLSIAEHFLAPVDLNIYPDYAYLIEYPIDLTTVKYRFENHFYRRITTAQFDVRYLATNAEKYNRSHTNIVKHARIITDLCLRIIREPNDIDVAAVYHQLVDVYHSSESENDNESDVVPSTSTGPTTSAAARQSLSSTRRSNRIRSDGDWRSDCRQLLDMMWLRPDSAPFREPVDTIEFPDYLEIISTPMDLRTVKEDLLGGNYEDPQDFAKDVRLIFVNSKNYNTNKRSRIYSMTLRLSALFESHIKTVISNWKAARRRANKNKGSPRGSSGSPAKRTPPERSHRAGPSTRRQPKPTRRLHISEDDDDDEDDDDRPRGSQRRAAAGAGTSGRSAPSRGGAVASALSILPSTSSSNRVTSSSSDRRGGRADDAAAPVRSSRRKAASQELDHVDEEEEEDEVHVTDLDHSSTTSSGDDSEDDDDASSDDGSGDSNAGRQRKRAAAPRNKRKLSGDEDSEESYNPDNERRGGGGTRGKTKRRKSSKKNKKRKQPSKRKRRVVADDDEDYTHVQRKSSTASAATTSNRRAGGASGSAQSSATKSQRRVGQRRNYETSEEDAAAAATTSQTADESTQDTISNTPKKKGRATKTTSNSSAASHNAAAAATAAMDGPTTSAAIAAMLQSPSRNTRNQLFSAAGGTVGSVSVSAGGSRRNATENDHSYHLPVRNGRIAESDTDSREVATARPTRSSVKRAIMDWARGSDVEEEPEESDEAEEILPTPTKITNGSNSSSRDVNNGPSTSRAATAAAAGAAVMRQLRTNRNTVVEPLDDDDDDDSDDDGSDNEPLATSQGSHHRHQTYRPPSTRSSPLKSSTPHPLQLQRVAATTHMTRSHAITSTTTTSTITTQSTATSSSSAAAPHAAHDHNYHGSGGGEAATSAGPSTSAAARNTRRVLSRHQRNADELDISLDPLENSRLLAAATATRLRRGLPTSTTALTAAGTEAALPPTINVRRGRSRYSQENSQPSQEEEDDNDNDNDDDAGASDEGTDGGSSTPPQSEDGAAAADSDSEDNQPLTTYVPTTASARRSTTTSSSRSKRREAKPKSNRRPRRRGGSDDDDDDDDDDFMCEDDDDEDYEEQRRRRRRQQQQQRRRRQQRHDSDRSGGGDGGAALSRTQRGSRNQKRPRYNEQSDEEDFTSSRNKRKREDGLVSGGAAVGGVETNVGGAATPNVASSSTSRAGGAMANVQYATTAAETLETAEGEVGGGGGDSLLDSDDDEQLVSVSSRGRVRKITAKARGIFKE